MKSLVKIILILSLYFYSNVHAYDGPIDGVWLLHNCEDGVDILDGNMPYTPPSKAINAGVCTGYLIAVHDINSIEMEKGKINKSPLTFYPPLNIGTEQEMRIVVKYLKNNPDKLNLPAFLLTMTALHQVWPGK